MRVIGVDPGLSHTGYGIVDVNERGKLSHVANGAIATSTRDPFVERLHKIHRELRELFVRFRPEHTAVESVFFAKNPKSALLLGQARGVALLSSALAGIPVFEYAATEIKLAVCGYGQANKEQVGAMVKVLLGLEEGLPCHASDALGACICHVHSYRLLQARREAGLKPARGPSGRALRQRGNVKGRGRS